MYVMSVPVQGLEDDQPFDTTGRDLGAKSRPERDAHLDGGLGYSGEDNDTLQAQARGGGHHNPHYRLQR